MELVLASVAIGSVALAAVLSIIAWKLLRQDRSRSAARIAALEALAEHELPELRTLDAPDDPLDLSLRSGPEPTPDPDVPADDTPAGDMADVLAPVPAISDTMFGAAQPEAPRTRAWGIAATVAAMVLVGAGTLYAVVSADVIAGTVRRITLAGARSAQPLELVSLRHAADQGRAFTVAGLVQNPGAGASLQDVVAVVYLFDDDGRYFATGRAEIDIRRLEPGDESAFIVTIPTVESVSRYRVGFRLNDGSVVAHVDRRDQPGQDRTEGPVNGVDRGMSRPPADSGRTEG